MTMPLVATTPVRRGRGTLAVFLGILAVFVLSLGTDQILHMAKVFPPWGQAMANGLFVLALSYRIVYAVLGGYVTARTAPDHPLRHAMILGITGVVMSTAAVAATWNMGPEFGPKWYPISLVITSIPCSWLGGKLFESRRG